MVKKQTKASRLQAQAALKKKLLEHDDDTGDMAVKHDKPPAMLSMDASANS
jgi:hypothetical protein